MTTARVTQRKSAPVFGFKVLDEAAGTFEAIVSVFGNVDLGNERVVAGAFKSSLEKWAASDAPIPVIFSHQWDNLDAHVGEVLEAKELAPGAPELPTELADLGGLWVKASMDLEEDFAGRLFKKMTKRRIKEFSFAYDVVKAKPGAGGALDLLELDVIEVGPTLKGMNPATALLSSKNATALAPDPLEALAIVDELVRNAAAQADEDEEPDPDDDDVEEPDPSSAGDEDPDAANDGDAAGEKSLPSTALGDSVEVTLNAIRDSAEVWATLEYGNELYFCHLEATFLDDARAIVTAERWSDPYGEGPIWELAYTLNDDGTVTIDDATELELTVELAAKRATRVGFASLMRSKSTLVAAVAATVTPASEGKADESSGSKAEDPKARTDDDGLKPGVALANIEALALS